MYTKVIVIITFHYYSIMYALFITIIISVGR